MGVMGSLIYLAIGLLYHLGGAGAFSWADPWFYVHVALWPFFVFLWVCAILFWMCAMALGIFMVAAGSAG